MGRRRPASVSPPINNLLVVRNDGIGDVVLTTPLLRALRQMYPHAWISLVVRPAVKNLVELCPYVNEVLVFDGNAKDRSEFRSPRRFWRALKLASGLLWKRDFDMAIVPRWEADHYHSSYIAYLSGASRRVGYSETVSSYKLHLNRGYDRLFTDVLRNSELKHELEHDLDMITYLGGPTEAARPEVWFSKDDLTHANSLLYSAGGDMSPPLVAFGIGGTSPARRWPSARYAEVATWLCGNGQARPLLVGGPADIALAAEFTASYNGTVINTVGKTTLRQVAAALSQCCFYIGNNTGPMHMAAALKLPVLEISCNAAGCNPAHYHSSRRFGPWAVPHCLVQPESPLDGCARGCSGSGCHCILQVSVDQVKRALASRLPNWLTNRAPLEPAVIG